MLDRAAVVISGGQSVILDATFQQREQRERAVALARRSGALAFCIETVASESIVRNRLAAREQDPAVVSDARWETYLIQTRRFEPVTELSDWQHLRIDTGLPIDDVVAGVTRALAQRLDPVALATEREG